MKEKDLAGERKDYIRCKLDKTDLLSDPIAQFERWLEDAFSAHVVEPTAMSLATAYSDGRPLVRTVLLKRVDQRGFVFFTNLESRKALQLKENALAALLFPWLLLERQVIVTGRTTLLSVEECESYFFSRPLESQLSAWASPQSKVIPSREFLKEEWALVKKKFVGKKIFLPAFWGGFCVVPDTIEFWQGGQHRLHDRLQYRRGVKNEWLIERLAP